MSSETTSSGAKANRTGNKLENFVERTLLDCGYCEFWNHKRQIFDNRRLIGGKQFAKQVPVGDTIYKTVRKCDFLIINRDKFADCLIIECKWQQSKGSVDEKYPFLLHNIVKTGVPTVLLVDGGGYKPQALKWLQSMVAETESLLHVWTMTEFQTAINNDFLG